MSARHRIAVTFTLAIALLLGAVSAASANTIRVNLKSRPFLVSSRVSMGSYRNACRVAVTGANAATRYNQSKQVAGVPGQTLRLHSDTSVKFLGTNIGRYNVSVDWAAGNGKAARKENKVVNIGFWAWEQDPTVEFTTP